MSIDPSSAVDLVSVDAESGALLLSIIDCLEWDEAHLFALQQRLNDCLAFIESGEIFAAYPGAAERDFMIDLVFTYRPTPEVSDFLAQAEAVIESAGYLFRYGPASSGYASGNL